MIRNPRNLTVRFPLVDIFSFLLKFPRVIVTQDLQLNEAGRELTWFLNFIMRFSLESSRKRQKKEFLNKQCWFGNAVYQTRRHVFILIFLK